ncbi:sulfite reductase flavoprotein subunit alpha [Stutzerimonas urumqiensis]|uniref:sulfite reductase subunit alpha n=1 Tax=Stutzerimonas urumqiensis TaxID=638269 RepID=UPI003BACE704
MPAPPLPAVARYWPLAAYTALAALLLWLRPTPEVAAATVTLAYLAGCARLWHRHRRARPGLQPGAAVLVAYASQGGHARLLAERTAEQLQQAGLGTAMRPLAELRPEQLAGRRALFIVATYGDGEAPDNGSRFERLIDTIEHSLDEFEYAVLALGDRGYRNFCGFGERLGRRLHALGGRPLFDRIDVDRLDDGALRHWQQQLGILTGHHAFSDWEAPRYDTWTLVSRQRLNPGSTGGPVYLLKLVAPRANATWRAGDAAEIGPRHRPDELASTLAQWGFDPTQPLQDGQPLVDVLADRQLPDDPSSVFGLNAEQLASRLPRLAHREYSIACTPAQGALELIVRLMQTPDGRPGIGSGWLCEGATLGSPIDLRIRSNPAFHGPSPQTPLILIGSGTGLAGLLAHLHAREPHPGTRNWLLFGERNEAHDRLLGEQLDTWQAKGHLERLDLAFSRDQPQRRYVQHALAEQADALRAWLDDGAAIYVCGGLEGMGRAVHRTLLDVLGESRVGTLIEHGRYCRDLY